MREDDAVPGWLAVSPTLCTSDVTHFLGRFKRDVQPQDEALHTDHASEPGCIRVVVDLVDTFEADPDAVVALVDMLEALGVSDVGFVHTNRPVHREVVQKMTQLLDVPVALFAFSQHAHIWLLRGAGDRSAVSNRLARGPHDALADAYERRLQDNLAEGLNAHARGAANDDGVARSIELDHIPTSSAPQA